MVGAAQHVMRHRALPPAIPHTDAANGIVCQLQHTIGTAADNLRITPCSHASVCALDGAATAICYCGMHAKKLCPQKTVHHGGKRTPTLARVPTENQCKTHPS